MSRIYHSHGMNTILSDKNRHIHVGIFHLKPKSLLIFHETLFFSDMLPSYITHNDTRKAKRSQL